MSERATKVLMIGGVFDGEYKEFNDLLNNIYVPTQVGDHYVNHRYKLMEFKPSHSSVRFEYHYTGDSR